MEIQLKVKSYKLPSQFLHFRGLVELLKLICSDPILKSQNKICPELIPNRTGNAYLETV